MYSAKYHVTRKEKRGKDGNENEFRDITVEIEMEFEKNKEIVNRMECSRESSLTKYLNQKEGFYFIGEEKAIPNSSYVYRDKDDSKKLEITPFIFGNGIELIFKTHGTKVNINSKEIIDIDSLYEFIKNGNYETE